MENNIRYIFLLAGRPATGKGFVARALRDYLISKFGPTAFVEKDALCDVMTCSTMRQFPHLFPEARNSFNYSNRLRHEEYVTVLKAIESNIDAKHELIDGPFSSEMTKEIYFKNLKRIFAPIAGKEVRIGVIYCTAMPEIVSRRMERRAEILDTVRDADWLAMPHEKRVIALKEKGYGDMPPAGAVPLIHLHNNEDPLDDTDRQRIVDNAIAEIDRQFAELDLNWLQLEQPLTKAEASKILRILENEPVLLTKLTEELVTVESLQAAASSLTPEDRDLIDPKTGKSILAGHAANDNPPAQNTNHAPVPLVRRRHDSAVPGFSAGLSLNGSRGQHPPASPPNSAPGDARRNGRAPQ